MSDDQNIRLSRRKVLGGLGTIGTAGALGGAGTLALFSDEEAFSNNQLTAGSLDLKVAVSQHYVDWLPDTDARGNVSVPPPQETDDARMPEPGETPDIRLNPGADGEDTKATPIELVLVDDEEDNGDFEDVPDDENALEFALGSLTNEINGGVPPGEFEDSLCEIGGDANDRVIVDLEDVKPGDFGLIRFAFASCNNPAFISLMADITSKAENGTSGPESDDPDEEEGVVELLDEVQLAVLDADVYDLLAGLDDGETLSADPQATLRDLEGGIKMPVAGDIPAEEGGGSGDLNCFAGETNHRGTLVWWLPVDHANEIQTDSAEFSLGVYAEQCRHNSRGGEETDCPDCSFDTDADVDGFTNLLSVGPDPSTGFPAIDARVRVDSAAGEAGDLGAEDFAICENGCGQTIEDVVFESGGAVDIVVVFDDTASMFNEIDALKSEVSSLTSDIESAGIDARYALISFKDSVEIDTDFTDASTFQSAVDGLSASGGGDTPEDNIDALAVGTGNAATESGSNELSTFRSGAQRIVIDITDVGAYDSTTDSRARFTQSEIETFLSDGNFTYYAVSPDLVADPVSKRDIANNVDDGSWIDIDGADFDVILNDIVGAITEPAYVLSYTTTDPTTDGSARTVDVEITDPDEGTAYEEGSYTAPSS